MYTIIQGVYIIQNKVTGMMYIGSSVSIKPRWHQHKQALKKGIHDNQHLQNSWDKHGEKSFEFKILEIVKDAESLRDKEQFWMDSYKSYERGIGYNKAVDAARPGQGMRYTPRNTYKGVCFATQTNKWLATVRIADNKFRNIACGSEEDAAKTYDSVMFYLYGEKELPYLNFPDSVVPISLEEINKQRLKDFKSKTTSKYIGVYWAEKNQKWVAVVKTQGRIHSLGMHDSEMEAAELRDAVALHLLGDRAKLNFGGRIPPKSLEQAKEEIQVGRRRKADKFIGVKQCVNKKRQPIERWRGEVDFGGRRHYTKMFPTKQEAAIARDLLALKIQGEKAILSFPYLRDAYTSGRFNLQSSAIQLELELY